MLVHELDATACRAVLGRCDLGRLACAHNDQPYIVPIHFSFDAGRSCLYACSTVGQKIGWMRQNPKVCLEVEEFADKDHWTTVLVFGRFEELGDLPVDTAVLRSARELFQQRREWWLPAAAKVGAHERHEMIIYRIVISRLTGRRASREGA
jgi:nitroimidazol reductase NimA-like FMN-containing flavoprotein (pyridoxamine 5'-phosphate oxidase superfamily)